MSYETVEAIAQAVFASGLVGDSLTLNWHSGEPLTVPVHFYREAIAVFERHNAGKAKLTHSIQTNGTLIDAEWCSFFKEYSIGVGISLDGTKELHDANRVNLGGKGTWEQVVRAISLLREHSVPFHTITVLSRPSLSQPRAIFEALCDAGVRSMGFNVEEIEGAHQSTSIAFAVIDEYKAFLREIVRLRSSYEEPLTIREVDDAIDRIVGARAGIKSNIVEPCAILSFDYCGNVSTFSPELLTMSHPLYGRFLYGNIQTQPLTDILDSPKLLRMTEDIKVGVEECRRTCRYFRFCGGGSPSNKLWETGSFSSSETMYCRFTIQCTTEIAIEVLAADAGLVSLALQ